MINTDDKSPDGITFKIVVMLMTCVTKDDRKFYPQLFLEEALLEVLEIGSSFL